jgi:hypothetical protein
MGYIVSYIRTPHSKLPRREREWHPKWGGKRDFIFAEKGTLEICQANCSLVIVEEGTWIWPLYSFPLNGAEEGSKGLHDELHSSTCPHVVGHNRLFAKSLKSGRGRDGRRKKVADVYSKWMQLVALRVALFMTKSLLAYSGRAGTNKDSNFR